MMLARLLACKSDTLQEVTAEAQVKAALGLRGIDDHPPWAGPWEEPPTSTNSLTGVCTEAENSTLEIFF